MRWIYGAVGVHRPLIRGYHATSRQTKWSDASTALTTAGTSMADVISGVQAANQGPGVDEFTTFMAGSSASPDALTKAAADASEFASAAGTVAQELNDVLTALDAAATTADDQINNPPWYAWFNYQSYFWGVLNSAKQTMQTLEQDAASAISSALGFSVDIPSGAPQPGYTTEPEYGMVSPEVQALWDEMTPEQREAVIKQLIVQHAADNGVTIDPNNIRIGPPTDKERDAELDGAWGVRYGDGEIWINGNHINDPILINTAVHESQHVVQNAAVDEYHDYSQSELEQMRNNHQNPFSEYGLTIDEVEAIARRKHIRPGDDYPGYFASPNEVDARQAGREAATMSEAEFLAAMEAAGVELE